MLWGLNASEIQAFFTGISVATAGWLFACFFGYWRHCRRHRHEWIGNSKMMELNWRADNSSTIVNGFVVHKRCGLCGEVEAKFVHGTGARDLDPDFASLAIGDKFEN